MAVPDIAQLCIVDLVDDGALGATTAFAADPRMVELLLASRTRDPLDAGGSHPVAIVARTGRAHLQRDIGPERLRAFAVDDEHLRLMTAAGYATSLAVPLVARGRTIGVLSFMRFGGAPPYSDEDIEMAGEIARRAALALDNARLFAELRRTEGQLEAVLANLAAAVTVQAADGSLVYVNQAAAETMGCASPEEVLSTPLAQLLEAFVVLDEAGRPFDLRDLPGRHALAGEEPRPALTHTIVKATGEERWAVTKATPVRDEQGDVVLAVNIIEDVTEAKIAERRERFLSEAGALLGSTLDYEQTLQHVAALVVPTLADWCALDLVEPGGGLQRVALAHADPDKRRLASELHDRYPPDLATEAGLAAVLRTGEALLVSEITEEILAGGTLDPEHQRLLGELGMRSGMLVPLQVLERTIGVLTLVNSDSQRSFGAGDLAFAEELALRVATAVHNARLYRDRRAG
jgi:PAS domain S-box-containing protein